jgi:hypothetical protein
MPDGLRQAATDVARHAKAVARLHAELTKSEVRSSGLLGFGAAVFAVLGFLLLTTLFVVALAIPLPLWLATLIVTLVYFAVAAVLGLALRKTRQESVAKDQVRLTAAALGAGRKGAAARTSPASPAVAMTGQSPPAARPEISRSDGD